MNKTKLSVILFFVLLSNHVFASNVWIWGHVDSLIPWDDDGTFVVDMKNVNIENVCTNNRVFVQVGTFDVNLNAYVNGTSPERVETALRMALTSVTSGMQLGIVIDPATVVNGQCIISSDSNRWAAIR